MATNDIKMGIWNRNSSNDHHKYNSKILTETSPPPPYGKWNMWKVVAKRWSPIEVWLSAPWKDPRETQKEDSHPKWVNVKYLVFRIWGIKTVPRFGFLGCTFLSFLNSELVWGQKKNQIITFIYLILHLWWFLVCNHVIRRPCWGSKQKNISSKNFMKIDFSSQRREMLLFLTTNMAAVTSRANQQWWWWWW